MNKNTIALMKGMIVVPSGSAEKNAILAGSVQAELMNLGFILEKSAFEALSKASKSFITSYHAEVMPFLKSLLGAGRQFKPFYVNFPQQVMEMSSLDLFVNAFVHYLSDGEWSPPQVEEARLSQLEAVNLKKIKLGTERDFLNLFKKTAESNQALTQFDKDMIEWFIKNERGNISVPAHIPFKETLCILAAHGMTQVSTITDVLRVAVFMSGGDISLPAIPKVTVKTVHQGWRSVFFDNLKNNQLKERDSFKFRKFSRPERRMLLGLMESLATNSRLDVSEMQSRLGRWLRLGERLHAGEYCKQYPEAAKAFFTIRNQGKSIPDPQTGKIVNVEKVRTFHGRVDLAFKRDYKSGIIALAERPGEFARKLDYLLRNHNNEFVLNVFEEVGESISGKVLFELHNHFLSRNVSKVRNIMLKGKRSRMKVLDPLPPMPTIVLEKTSKSILNVIKKKMSSLGKLGKVWVDPQLKNIPIPSAMRSVNTAVKTYIRGTRIPLSQTAKVIRAFVHWFDEHGTHDIDLSAGFYGEKGMTEIDHITFTKLRSHSLNCCHSGDIRHRRGACAEYIDIDIERCLKMGVRYVVLQAYNYDGRPIGDIKDTVFGLMEREHPKANEIFVPKTISNCIAITNEGTNVIPGILDLQERTLIWVDIERSQANNTHEGSQKNIAESLLAFASGNGKMTVYDLLKLHAEARGKFVEKQKDADVVMKADDFITDYVKVASYTNI